MRVNCVGDGHPRDRDRRVGGQVDRQPGDLAALVQAQRRLPVAVDGQRLGDPVAARPDFSSVSRRPRPVLALPGGHVEPVGAVGGVGRVELDLAVATSAVRAFWRVRSRVARTPGAGGDRDPEGDHADDARPPRRAATARGTALAARSAGAQAAADEAADHAAGDRGDQAGDRALGEEGARARDRPPRRGTSAHSAASPTVPMPRPASAPKVIGGSARPTRRRAGYDPRPAPRRRRAGSAA